MNRKDIHYSIDAIKINKDSYRPVLNFTRFARYLLCIILRGESPIENRTVYVRRHYRH
ncbi:hypothetical protein [Flavihumibacter petaseus]|uniref:Uncharacterized protein n=1 Tax=Flavihumibacter petaseus NBRC 106054 TaxID=1220578 RepID=A0A0E9MY26_9BACT|nr:hypothetical protein [Flavihumibacter petaseus]GAO42393.1 hypothetical protein FPE01S_01_14080 [Flavihumibacter petaseus NBRC 106054]